MFYLVVVGFTGFLLGFTEISWFLLGLTGLYCVFLCVLPWFSGLYRVLSNFSVFKFR